MPSTALRLDGARRFNALLCAPPPPTRCVESVQRPMCLVAARGLTRERERESLLEWKRQRLRRATPQPHLAGVGMLARSLTEASSPNGCRRPVRAARRGGGPVRGWQSKGRGAPSALLAALGAATAGARCADGVLRAPQRGSARRGSARRVRGGHAALGCRPRCAQLRAWHGFAAVPMCASPQASGIERRRSPRVVCRGWARGGPATGMRCVWHPPPRVSPLRTTAKVQRLWETIVQPQSQHPRRRQRPPPTSTFRASSARRGARPQCDRAVGRLRIGQLTNGRRRGGTLARHHGCRSGIEGHERRGAVDTCASRSAGLREDGDGGCA